nr:cytochrome P450 CYP4BQ2 [Dendroctonus rhizophagus]
MTILYVLLSLLVGLLTFLFWKHQNVRKQLKWVPTGPTYYLLEQCDLMDSTKSLEHMRSLLAENNGLCYLQVLSRPVLLISDKKMLEWLLSSNTILKKPKAYDFLHGWLQGGLLISDGAEWRNSRKILSPAFHFGVLEQYVEFFEDPTREFLEILREQCGQNQVDIRPYVSTFTLDVICRTAMGVQLNIQTESRSEYFNAVSSMCELVVKRAFSPLKSFDCLYHFTADYAEEKKHLNMLHKVSNDVIELRQKLLESEEIEDDVNEVGAKRKMAFLDLLLKYRDANGKPLSKTFIRKEVDTFMFAGHDTTASALSFALYCLANHADVQAKARNEVHEVVEASEALTYKNLQEMKYLDRVIKETLRLYPSVPYYGRITTEEVTFEANKIIPKGVALNVVAYAVNRNPEVFQNPDEFIPTRFLGSEIKPFTYLPFSAGPRNCIGQKFVMLEIKFALARILQNFELSPATPNVALILSAEAVLQSKTGVNISLKQRNRE